MMTEAFRFSYSNSRRARAHIVRLNDVSDSMEEISFLRTERRRAKCAAKRDTISGNIKEKGFHVSARNPPAFLIAREGTRERLSIFL